MSNATSFKLTVNNETMTVTCDAQNSIRVLLKLKASVKLYIEQRQVMLKHKEDFSDMFVKEIEHDIAFQERYTSAVQAVRYLLGEDDFFDDGEIDKGAFKNHAPANTAPHIWPSTDGIIWKPFYSKSCCIIGERDDLV